MRKLILACILILAQLSLFAQRTGIPAKPNPPRLVNNLSSSGFLSDAEVQQLEDKLVKFEAETSNQIVIVIVDDLNGYEPFDYATELGQQWAVGQEKEDNGVVILIKPTGGKGEKKTFIAPGRGLEGAIPDLTAKQIVDNEMIPNFKNGANFQGIDQAVNVIMSLAKGEYNHKSYSKKHSNSSGFIIVVVIIIIIVLIVRFGPKGGGGGNGFTYGAGGFMAGRAFGSGFGGSSGGSSGGFGGFGGGSFGGGGSGGSW